MDVEGHGDLIILRNASMPNKMPLVGGTSMEKIVLL